MQALDLNLASRPFRNNTLLWAGYLLAFVLLVLFSVYSVRTYRAHVGLLDDLEQHVASIESQFADLALRDQKATRQMAAADLRSLTIQTLKANEMIQWKAFSWTELFNVLEAVQPHDVRMTAVYPSFREARQVEGAQAVVTESAVPVSVEGLARDYDAFFELETALQGVPHFDHVQPERMARVEGSGELAFQLKFLYDPTVQRDAETAPPGPPAPADAPAGEAPVDEAAATVEPASRSGAEGR